MDARHLVTWHVTNCYVHELHCKNWLSLILNCKLLFKKKVFAIVHLINAVHTADIDLFQYENHSECLLSGRDAIYKKT